MLNTSLSRPCVQDAVLALEEERRRGREAELALLMKEQEARESAAFQVRCGVYECSEYEWALTILAVTRTFRTRCAKKPKLPFLGNGRI